MSNEYHKAKHMHYLMQMIEHIRKNHIYDFNEFIDFCIKEKTDWLDCIVNSQANAYIIVQYIESFRKSENPF